MNCLTQHNPSVQVSTICLNKLPSYQHQHPLTRKIIQIILCTPLDYLIEQLQDQQHKQFLCRTVQNILKDLLNITSLQCLMHQ